MLLCPGSEVSMIGYIMRAQSFAKVRKQQLLWIQSEDTPPNEHYAHYTKEELTAEKMKWNSPNYHARKTEGILSLMPLIYGMPWRLTGGQGAHFKESGIHNSTRGCVRAWTLHEDDEKQLAACRDSELILKHLPRVVWLESEQDLRKQHPDAPKKELVPNATNHERLDFGCCCFHRECTQRFRGCAGLQFHYSRGDGKAFESCAA